MAPTHAEGRSVSAAVREELRRRGKLGAEDHTLIRYESKGLTEQQKRDALYYQEGDMVQWHQHAPGFKSGQRLTVVGREGDAVLVGDASGQVKPLSLEHAGRFELYRTSSLPVAAGDVLRVVRNGSSSDKKKHRLNNGDLIRVASFSPAGDIIDDRGWTIGKDYGHLAHGVVTSHASQGMDKDVAFVAQSASSLPASNAQQFYVSASRGVLGLRIYTDDKEALKKAVMRSDQARSASEVWQARQAEQAEAVRCRK